MVITKENYYSIEADLSTMSVSQYKLFKQCELMAMAKLKGEYKQSESDAFLLGKYIHSWSEGTLDDFKKKIQAYIQLKAKLKGN
ncbi:hypothetical protein BJV39_000008 [Clostridium beijerinckii]|nr:PD-(D/E)XK nuclease-like domain-containing protein [Clostridium beijerinckii]NRU35913.1 hypothetical protein [Clostridium beijerinckii]